MKKSERKANAKLEEARKYVSQYKASPAAKPSSPQASSKSKSVAKGGSPAAPCPAVASTSAAWTNTAPRRSGKRIDSVEIKKMQKGYFFIVAICNGERIEIQKRFKSITKANDWLAKNDNTTARTV